MADTIHSIYSPLSWQEGLGYSTALTISWDGPSKGKHRCRESVHNGRSGFSQCVRVGTVCEEVRGEQMWFCGQHSEVKQKERRAATAAKHDAEMARLRTKWAAQGRAATFQAALEQIATGHNDARGFAEAVLREAGVLKDRAA